MALPTKPDMTYVWASGGAKVAPGNTKIATGWTAEVPAFQWENWSQNRQDAFLDHINKSGFPVWDGLTNYEAAGQSLTKGSDGVIYKSVAASGPSTTVQDPVTDVSDTYWTVAFASVGAFLTQTAGDARYTQRANNLSDVTNVNTARTNLGVFTDTVRVDVASAANVNLTSLAPNTRDIQITGTTTITSFTIVAGQKYFVRFGGSLTLTNNASIVTQTGANIVTNVGDTCIIRATAANVVEVLSYSRVPQFTIGSSITLTGTAVDVTAIPSWVRRISLVFSGASLSGASQLLIQVGSGSVQTTGYQSSSAAVSTTVANVTTGVVATNGFVTHITTPSYLVSGVVQLIGVGGNIWVASHALGGVDSRSGGGNLTSALSGVLDRVRITALNGTDTFDAGTVTLIYEG